MTTSQDPVTLAKVARVHQAFIKQIINGTLILDQANFIFEYQQALANVPEAEKSTAAAMIRQFMSRQYESDELPTFGEWIKLQEMEDVFFTNEMTQEERYHDIVARLKETELRQHAAQTSFLELSKSVRDTYKTYKKCSFFQNHRSDINRLRAATRKVNRWKVDKREFEIYQRGLILSQQSSQMSSAVYAANYKVDIRPDPLGDSVMLKVYQYLTKAPFYHGYKGGTYVFRYKDESACPISHFEDALWMFEPDDALKQPAFEELLGPGPGSEEHFRYCGYVPRHKAEHIGRLKVIQSRVIHMIIATLTFIDWRCTVGNFVSVADLRSRRERITGRDLAIISWYWDFYFEDKNDLPMDVRNAFRESPVITEFVYLLALLDIKLEGLMLMERILCEATGWTREELVQKEDKRQAGIATSLLLDEGQVDSCFVFDDAGVMNIHEHFQGSQYNCDPNHPEAQYPTAGIIDYLETEYRFLQSFNARWETRDRSLDPPTSTLGLSRPQERTSRKRSHGGTTKTGSASQTQTTGSELTGLATPESSVVASSPAATNPPESSVAASSAPATNSSAEPSQASTSNGEPAVKKRGPGRPPGSKNKPKGSKQ